MIWKRTGRGAYLLAHSKPSDPLQIDAPSDISDGLLSRAALGLPFIFCANRRQLGRETVLFQDRHDQMTVGTQPRRYLCAGLIERVTGSKQAMALASELFDERNRDNTLHNPSTYQ